MTTGRVTFRRARAELRRKREEHHQRREAREPFEVAWDRERAQRARQVSDVERVAGRAAGGLVTGVLVGSWLDLSLASFLALVVTTMVAWAALGWFFDRLEGEPPAR